MRCQFKRLDFTRLQYAIFELFEYIWRITDKERCKLTDLCVHSSAVALPVFTTFSGK